MRMTYWISGPETHGETGLALVGEPWAPGGIGYIPPDDTYIGTPEQLADYLMAHGYTEIDVDDDMPEAGALRAAWQEAGR